jgi:hypothetical protein
MHSKNPLVFRVDRRGLSIPLHEAGGGPERSGPHFFYQVGLSARADKVAEGEVDPEELLESVSVPGLPDSNSWEGYEGWTAGLVRAVIDAIAQTTDEEPEELLEAATRNAWFKAERTKLEAEKVERDLRNMVRERLLPDEKTLEKVARYEAHLSRGLYKALHELEALQLRRSGGVAPLARLDVDGLAEG